MAANPIGLNSYWNGPVLYSSTSTAPSNEAGRYLIVERRHVRSHPGIRTKLPTIHLVVRVGGFAYAPIFFSFLLTNSRS